MSDGPDLSIDARTNAAEEAFAAELGDVPDAPLAEPAPVTPEPPTEQAAPPEPAAPPAVEPEPVAAEPEPEAVDPVIAARLAALVSKGEKAHQAKVEAQSTEERAQALVERAEQVQRDAAAQMAKANDLIATFRNDPIAAAERAGHSAKDIYERAQRMTLDKDGTQAGDRLSALESKLDKFLGAFDAKLDEKIAPMTQYREEQAAERQAHELATTKRDFVEYVGRNAEKFKLSATLDGQQLASDLVGAMHILQNEGAPFTWHAAAAKVEEYYSGLQSRWSPDQQAATAAAPRQTAPASPRQPAAQTLTNQEGAAQAIAAPPSDDDRFNAAVRVLQG